MTAYQLANLDARLTYLALRYHLARPGSELDPETKEPVAHGLEEVARAIEPQLDKAAVSLELTPAQHERLLSALSGTLNELKTYPMMDRRTLVPAFDETLRRLFPEVADEPDEATQLAARVLQLRRRLERSAPAAGDEETQTRGKRPWWRFWDRGGA
jgi:hypothetical protein